MASYRTEEQINVDAEIELEITVQDQNGNEIDCDIDGYGFSLTAQINTQSIKDDMVDEVREEIKDELRDELKDELELELQEEFKAQLCKEIAIADSPINALSGVLSLIAIEHDKVNNVMNESIAKLNTRLHEQAQEIQDLKSTVAAKDTAISCQNQAIQNLQVKLDERNKTNKKLRDGLMEYERLSDEKRLAEEAAQGGPLSIIKEHNTLEEAREAASREAIVAVEGELNNLKENK